MRWPDTVYYVDETSPTSPVFTQYLTDFYDFGKTKYLVTRISKRKYELRRYRSEKLINTFKTQKATLLTIKLLGDA